MIRKLLFLLAIFITATQLNVHAQQYIGSVGLRLGTPIGGAGKYFLTEWHAVEGIFATSWDGFSATVLFQKHWLVKRRTPLFGYYGAGAHVGFWDSNAPWVDSSIRKAIYGVDAVIGMEYIMDEAPISVSVDWIPALHFNADRKLYPGQLGVTIRLYLY